MWAICDSLLCFIDINGREPWQSLLEKLLFFLDALQSPPATKKTKNNLRSQWALDSLTVTWDNALGPLLCPWKESYQAFPLSSLLTPTSSLFFTNLVPRISLLSMGTSRREPWKRGWFFTNKLTKDSLIRYSLFICWKFGSLAARPLTLRAWAFPLCVLL